MDYTKNYEEKVLNYIISTGKWDLLKEHSLTIDHFPIYSNVYKKLENDIIQTGVIQPIESVQAVIPSFEKVECRQSELKYNIDTLKYLKFYKELAKNINNLSSTLNDEVLETYSYIDAYSKVKNICSDIIESTMGSTKIESKDTENIAKILKEDFIHKKDNLRDKFYTTGLDWLDDILVGWDKEEDYVVVSGRAGTAKTMLLCHFAATSLKNGKRVLFYEGEMSLMQTANRIISNLANIPTSALNRGDKEVEDVYFHFLDTQWQNYNLNIVTPKELGRYASTDDLEALCHEFKADVLIIDQQSLMTDLLKGRTLYERATNISRQIKAMRDRLGIPVLTAVQMNRTKNDDGSVDTSQLAGSDVIGQDATRVIMLSRDGEEYVKMTIAKNRFGKSYVDKKYFANFDYCSFLEVEEGSEEISISVEEDDFSWG